MAFCDFVRSLREQNHLTQGQIANYLNVNINTIKQIEANKIKAPSNRVLDSLCKYLDEDRLTVINKILFKKDKTKRCDENYHIEQTKVLSMYISYLYLEGWNIDKAPVTYQTKDIGALTYAGQLTKKREPNNKIVVKSIGTSFDTTVDVISNDEAIYYITSSMAAFFCIDKIKLKGIHVLFDAQNQNQTKLFAIFKNLDLNKVPFHFRMILFHSRDGKVLDTKEL